MTYYRLFQRTRCVPVLMNVFARSWATAAPCRLVELSSRSVLRARGPDSFKLLQGIVSNDLLLLKPGSSLYSMILNAKGRTVYDIIIYVRNQEVGTFVPEYLIESDACIAEDLCAMLKRYRMRSKVELEIAKEWGVWCVLPSEGHKNLNVDYSSAILSVDPRLVALGHRLLLPRNANGANVLPNSCREEPGFYRRLRYQLGVCEGVEELPPGETLPLESNLAWLNGVSFSKGCYVGQELTSRTHHTGVIRKRVMPISMVKDGVATLEPGSALLTSTGRSVGKVRAWDGKYGLALLRLANIADGQLSAELANEEKISVTARRPLWWPSDGNAEI